MANLSKDVQVIPSSLIKAQVISGLVFGTFLALHLTNTTSAIGGQLVYDELQRFLRLYYQNRWIEPVVVFGSLSVHLVTGWYTANTIISLLRANKRTTSLWNALKNFPSRINAKNMHRITGWILATFIAGHIAATRGPSLWDPLNNWTGFSATAFALEHFPSIFYPYYVMFGACGVYHLMYGVAIAPAMLGWTKSTLSAEITYNGSDDKQVQTRQISQRFGLIFWGGVGLGIAACVSGVIAFGGSFYPVTKDAFPLLQAFYEKLIPYSLQVWNHK